MNTKNNILLGTYGSISDGYTEIDHKLYDAVSGEEIKENSPQVKSLIKKEDFELYRKCGFDVMSTGITPYYGTDYENSFVYKTLKLAEDKGLKVIVLDGRLLDLCNSEAPLVGCGRKFETREKLDEYVESCIKEYRKSDAFFALNLRDEPKYTAFPAISEVYKSLNRIAPEIKVFINLLPLVENSVTASCYAEGGTSEDIEGAYLKYLDSFTQATGLDYIMLDSYPFCESADGSCTRMNRHHLRCIKTVADYCAKRKLKFYLIVQTFDMDAYDGKSKKLIKWYRKCKENDVYWQTNLAVASGVRFLQYYTYFPHRGNCTESEMFGNEGCIVKRDGTPTPLYQSVKKINGELKKIAPEILSYEYKKCGVKISDELARSEFFDKEYLDKVNAYDEEFERISLTAEEGAIYVAEKYNPNNGAFAYMLINIADPSANISAVARIKGKNCRLRLSEIIEAENELDGETICVRLNPGRAVFVVAD